MHSINLSTVPKGITLIASRPGSNPAPILHFAREQTEAGFTVHLFDIEGTLTRYITPADTYQHHTSKSSEAFNDIVKVVKGVGENDVVIIHRIDLLNVKHIRGTMVPPVIHELLQATAPLHVRLIVTFQTQMDSASSEWNYGFPGIYNLPEIPIA